MPPAAAEAIPPGRPGGRRASLWLFGLVPLALIGALVTVFVSLGGPGLGQRKGPPVEQLAVERTVLRPGVLELTVRNDGPDSVRVAQVLVNDSFVTFDGGAGNIARLASARLRIDYPWIEGEAYTVSMLTSAGETIDHEIPVAVETPEANAGFYGLMALLGLYVGVIPVAIGMLWLPLVRRITAGLLGVLMAVTVGLLGFLAIDATLEGIKVAGEGSQAFGADLLVFLGAVAAYLALAAVDAHVRSRRERMGQKGLSGGFVALLVAIGIGLHNLGEGLAIGSSYAVGALALGAFLVIGFALHNTTEGLAIVAASAADRPPALSRLAGLGVIAGAPAILGAWIGGSAFNPSLAAFLLGAGAGAIAQVIVQIAPAVRDGTGRLLHPASVAGMLGGLAVLYVTGLLISV